MLPLTGIFWPGIFVFPVLNISSLPSLVPQCSPAVHSLSATAPRSAAGWCSTMSWRWVHCQLPEDTSPPTQFFIYSVFAKYCSPGEQNYFFLLQGLKSVDSSVKKEGDLPAADPSTPIPLKYEDESTSGGPESLEKQMALFLDKSKLYCCANKTFPVPTRTAATLFWLSRQCV